MKKGLNIAVNFKKNAKKLWKEVNKVSKGREFEGASMRS